MYGARRDHIERTITPALERGAWVVCDRFAALETHVLGTVRPDLTLVFDLPVEVGLARAEVHAKASGHAETRFESKGLAFHERLRTAFGQIAAAEPQRCVLVDAAGSIEAVESDVWAAVSDRLHPHG